MSRRQFWSKVYLPNIRRNFPELLQKYGTPMNVMNAEKQYIWDLLDYDIQCAAVPLDKCKDYAEKRHKSPGLPYAKKRGYQVCRVKDSKCAPREVNKKQSLQFLRWLLHETKPKAFAQYVEFFPHQLAEVNYGYNIDRKEQYIPVEVVAELQEARPSASADRKFAKCSLQVKRLQNELEDMKYNIDGIVEENKEMSARLKEMMNKNKMCLNDEMKCAAKLKEVNDALVDAKSYATECVSLRQTIKQLRNDLEELEKLKHPTNKQVKEAYDIISLTAAKLMLPYYKKGEQEKELMKIVRMLKEVSEFIKTSSHPSESAREVLDLYISLFSKNGFLHGLD